MVGFVQITRSHIHLQHMLAPGPGRDALLSADQFARHQGEQIAGFFVRVHPLGQVAAFGQVGLFDQIAVGQQHGVSGFVGTQADLVQRHHIGAVQEIRDAAKTLGFTLGEKGVLAQVQARELGVLLGRAGGEDFQLKGVMALGQVFQHQLPLVHFETGALAVDHDAGQVQFFAIQAQWLCLNVWVSTHLHFVEHAGLQGVEVNGEVDGVDPICGWHVVFAANQRGSAF